MGIIFTENLLDIGHVGLDTFCLYVLLWGLSILGMG